MPLKRKKPHLRSGNISVQRRSEISQVHCVFAAPGVPFSSPERYALSILNTALGGGMSSRLFQGLREQHGLVYNVQSFIDLYSDCGIMGFYFTCDKNNLSKVADQLKIIFHDISNSGFGHEEIELAKTYLSGNLMLSLESSTNRMLRFGREMSILKKITPVDTVINNIRMVNEKQINELVAQYQTADKYTIAAIGPVTEDEIRNIFHF